MFNLEHHKNQSITNQEESDYNKAHLKSLLPQAFGVSDVLLRAQVPEELFLELELERIAFEYGVEEANCFFF